MKINYNTKMGFSAAGRAALKQDFSDFYHMVTMELQDEDDKQYVGAWGKKYHDLIVAALVYLVDAEKGRLDDSNTDDVKELWLSLHEYYTQICFHEKIFTDPQYQAHDESFLMKFK